MLELATYKGGAHNNIRFCRFRSKGKAETTSKEVVYLRLAGRIKMGYYPTPLEVVDRIKSFINFGSAEFAALDPCVGCGTALAHLLEGTKGAGYGIELDETRAKEARGRLHKVVKGAYEKARVSHTAFSLMLLNPPYDTEAAAYREREERKEKTFLCSSLYHLVHGGILVYIIPQKQLTPDVVKVLSYRFQDLQVFRFQDEKYEAYNQVVVFGVRKKRPSQDKKAEASILHAAFLGEHLDEIPFMEKPVYVLPPSKVPVPTFIPGVVDQEELAELALSSPLWNRLGEVASTSVDKVSPPLPLHQGHVALLLASGLLDGEVGTGSLRHLVRGRAVRTTIKEEELTDSGTKMIERDVMTVKVKMLLPNGQIKELM